MGTLKRLSYDNIVEHNPTAPDPVEGGGEGGGSMPKTYFGGSYTVDIPRSIPASAAIELVPCNIIVDESADFPSGVNPDELLPIYNVYSLSIPEELKDYYAGYTIDDVPGENGYALNVSVRLLPHQNAITIPPDSGFILCQVVFAETYVGA